MLVSGTRLGPYEIVAPLGAGGMGEVYRARDTQLGRDVAIKALPAEFARDAERLARFRREAQTLAALNHPNVASIYGLEESGGMPHLVLELVEGESLLACLARGPLPPREAVRVGIQVAAAIEAAHERGIVHRDLKPGNVMLSDSGLAKVLDFGLARSEAPPTPSGDPGDSPTMTLGPGATLAGAILGTAAYMSPEQARGRQVDRRSDVWSFGCLLFECLAGRPAFEGATTSDLIARILEREPDWNLLPAGTPARVREVLRRCLRKDADARPRDIRDVRLDLSEAADGGTRAAGARDNSIAVLPFENLSGADDEYFADGVTDEILNALSQLEGLRVAARASCFAFKGRREDPRAVGEKLDVAAVLDGTVRRSGARLRITAQLVNAADGRPLWSERYDGEMTDVFEVQDKIAEAIAGRLRVALQGAAGGERGRRGTDSVEAYELFLKGRALLLQRGRFIQEAIPFFQRALELDPRYAEAMALLADSYRLLGTFGVVPCDQVMPRASELSRRALEIEPGLAEAWATLASVESQYEHRIEQAAVSWREALESDPRHIRARCERAMWSHSFGKMPVEEALAETSRAVEYDPFNAWALCIHSFILGYAGRPGDALEAAARAVAADAGSFMAQWTLMRAHALAGDVQKAQEMSPALLASSGRNVWALATMAWFLGKSGQPVKARAVYDELEARSRLEHVSHFWMSVAAAAAGCGDTALQHVRLAVAQRDPLMVSSRVFPHCDALRALPGFEEAVKGAWD
ncbi:MAG: protein kinase [Candidatus Eisenbacteria bacterium]|nr:protein kinase [Candidatus Eisenbacteria bacterium]